MPCFISVIVLRSMCFVQKTASKPLSKKALVSGLSFQNGGQARGTIESKFVDVIMSFALFPIPNKFHFCLDRTFRVTDRKFGNRRRQEGR